MLKHLYFFAAAFNALTLYRYLVDEILPDKFTIGFWGVFTIVILFLEALKGYYVEKTQVLLQQEFDKTLAPILKDSSLTNQEKQDKINDILAEKLVNRIAKNAKIQKKENTDE